MKAVAMIAIAALYENGRIGEAFDKYLAANIAEMHTFADVLACILDGTVTIDIAELAKAKAIGIVGRIGETVHNYRMRIAAEHFAYTTI